ncbi:MAG: aminoacyl-histidine dipeptidase, partial [Clostridia bacterium]|nr:aminoacyl-histidine dipeptidase [Clostridia bacterium]
MNRVIEIFKEICAVPHGSGNMEKIAEYCIAFGKKCGLDVYLDDAKNVIIKKSGTRGFENAQPVILQGHMDMVCQKEDGVEIDFEKEGITPVIEGDFMKAKGTTLGADNGIAVAMILAV